MGQEHSAKATLAGDVRGKQKLAACGKYATRVTMTSGLLMAAGDALGPQFGFLSRGAANAQLHIIGPAQSNAALRPNIPSLFLWRF
jgi:hypothetical protein